jgi:FkbM family methyltransferase
MKYMKHYASKFNMIRYLLKKENPTIVEIGAHYGEDSLRFLEAFRDVNLFCFEPDPRNVEIFKKYVNDDRVKLFEVALSDKKGKANFYQSYQEYNQSTIPGKYDWISKEEYVEKRLNNSGSSSLKKGYPHILNEQIEVSTERYDTWCKENNIDNVDFVWMDVQGAERDVINGMGEEIQNIHFIWMEYGEEAYEDGMNRNDTLILMNTKGFQEVREFSNYTPQGDILFVNRKFIF